MKNTTIFFLAFLFSASASATSVGAGAFVEKYLQDFEGDKDLTSYFLARPQFIFGHTIHIPDSSSEASEYVRELRKKLNASHYGKSIINASKVLASIDDYTLITLGLTRYKKDSSILDKTCSTYGVLSTRYGFKILSWQTSEPTKSGSC